MRELIEYDIVKHFKYETLTKEQQKAGLYTYRIVSLDAVHTETGEHLVIYKALYDGRPYGIDVVPDIKDNLSQMPDGVFDELAKEFGLPTDGVKL